MKVFAGTSKGVFALEAGGARQVLHSRGVRDLVRLDGNLFAGTGAGLYVSEDDGESWQCVALEDREIWQVRSAGNGIYYAGTQPAGLFRSDDAGNTWREVESFANAPESADWCVPVKPPLPGRARALVIDREDANRMWVGVEVGGIMRTEDGGTSWQLDLPGNNPDLHMMYAHPEQAGVLFASTGYGRADGVAEMIEGNAGVFRSDDHGATWHYAWKGITPRYSRPMCIDER
ncbi:MAG: glycoside hydrolase, partial [Gammaproteobacteria bacterium]|nr:glycoside hydrolase [Gammaproteobacteria bacterium]